MSERTTDALLLRAVDYGERDRVATFLTRELGKLSVFASGARGSRTRFVAAFEPFAVLRVRLAPGRGELWRLRDAHVERAFSGVLRDLERMRAAAAALEIVREALPDGARDDDVLDECVALLEALDTGEPVRPVIVGFLLRALAQLGHAPRLDACAACGRPRPAQRPAFFEPSRGGVICQQCGGGALRLASATLDLMLRADAGELVPWSQRALAESVGALLDHAEAQIGKALPCCAELRKALVVSLPE